MIGMRTVVFPKRCYDEFYGYCDHRKHKVPPAYSRA